MIRSRSPPGRRSSSEELEVIQRKHLERREAASHHVKRRGPVRPEGPRAPGVQTVESRSREHAESRSPEYTHRASEHTYPTTEQSRQAEEQLRRAMVQSLRASEQRKRVPKSTQSMPERRSPAGIRGVETHSRSKVDPWGKSAKVMRAPQVRNLTTKEQSIRNQPSRVRFSRADSSVAESIMVESPMVESSMARPVRREQIFDDPAMKEMLLRQQVKQQIVNKQNREAQAVLEQQLLKSKKKKIYSKKVDCYDQYTGAESTSGFSRYSDKYKVVDKSKKDAAPSEQQTGAQLGTGQFATNVGVMTAANSLQTQNDIVVAETCPNDFLESMIMPPAPPTEQEQMMITTGIRSMALASGRAVENDDCGAFLPLDEEPQPLEVKRTDWYEKEADHTQDTFVGDLFHTLWTCS